MSKHNYSQYSNKKKNIEVNTAPENTVEIQNGVIGEVVTGETETTTNVTIEQKSITDTEVTETVIENKSTVETNSGAVSTGVIANCAKLNVRSKPNTNGDVLAVLNVNDKISIDVDESTDEWFKIRTADGVNGYCMRKFVNANI